MTQCRPYTHSSSKLRTRVPFLLHTPLKSAAERSESGAGALALRREPDRLGDALRPRLVALRVDQPAEDVPLCGVAEAVELLGCRGVRGERRDEIAVQLERLGGVVPAPRSVGLGRFDHPAPGLGEGEARDPLLVRACPRAA